MSKNKAGGKTDSIQLEQVDSAAVYYVNYIEVGNSSQDFSLLCARMPGKLTPAKIEEANREGVLMLETELQIVIQTTLVTGLIRALTTRKELYEKTFGVQIKEVEVQRRAPFSPQ